MSSTALRTSVAVAILAVSLGGACSGDAADETVRFESHDFAYTGLQFEAKAGDEVAFVMKNMGPAEHEFEVSDPDGKELGEIEPTALGKTGKVTLKLTKPGVYRFACGVEDHESRGMKGTFRVS